MTDAQLLAEADQHIAAIERQRYDWPRHSRPAQREPGVGYRTWLILAGRGYGKTRTGAETVRTWAGQKARGHYAVVAKTHREVQAICYDAPRAGLNAVIPPEQVAQYKRSGGQVLIRLHNGSIIRAFSAEDPDVFRGYAFDGVWCDEYAAWPRKTAQACMDMLWFCLREAPDPRVVITTTPKALPHIKKLVERGKTDPSVVITRGHTLDNRANLSEAAIAELMASYEGTRLGRQELAGELLEEVEGALWTPSMFEWDGFRLPYSDLPTLDKRVCAVDPAVTSSETSDQYGIGVGGVRVNEADGLRHVYGLLSEAWRATPEAAMKRVASTFGAWDCNYVIVETNNGGDYIPALLRTVDDLIPVRKVVARKGKILRAEPVSQLYEQRRVHHVGPPAKWAALESIMTTFTGDPAEDSPDDLDAHVYEVLALAGPTVRDSTATNAAGYSKSAPPGASGVAGIQISRTLPPRQYG
jgi:phage terminase large subunit-like protein